ncbi:MAG: VWA domain-containing protein [Alphaproteobacteria bacterium]|nr:VWA domain-containing protein [Alphaproteobacteria bacterium]
MAKLPTSTEDEVARFLKEVSEAPVPARPDGERGRLVFAMDATASREPTWDRACHIQSEMFSETSTLGGLAVQLLYYRGFGQCRASKWAVNPSQLLRFMTSVRCLGGSTQIRKVLKHAIKENGRQKVNALVFVGDAMEEDVDELCHHAGELGLLNIPVFVFHEGGDPIAERAFRQISRLSGGAYCPFDSGSAQQLKDLLSAVAVYAAGGRQAMLSYGKKKGGDALRLTHQLQGKG